jgi:hypothetical protein
MIAVVSRTARRFAAVVAGAALAFGLAAGSVAVHRPVLTVVGNMCEPTGDNPSGFCYRGLPAGGWPFAFLYDSPATSVLDQLGLEDDFKAGWFLIDAAIFGALPAAAAVAFRLRRHRPPAGASSTGTPG